jgi:hypothetical protein
MWRLKIAEGGNNPYLFSTNNFVGRQIWEFDPNAGSPEERAEVEEARQNFYYNRHKNRNSSDLLWRLQVISSLYTLSIFFVFNFNLRLALFLKDVPLICYVFYDL